MISKTLLFFVIVNFVSVSYGERSNKFFRNDYNYMESYQSFYKLHTIPQTWTDAKRVCALEGATLWHPDNDNEANDLIAFWKKSKPKIEWIFVGLSDLLVEGVFETVAGKPISQVYNNWEPGQPDNYRGVQDCTRMKNSGGMDDIECTAKYPFICKKTLSSLEWNNQCKIPNLDYTYNKFNNNCYKVHTTPVTWTEAYAVCQIEQSSLAVVKSRLEADFLASLTEATPKPRVKGKYQRGIYHLGFHNRLNEGWQTVTGASMNLDSDAWFERYQPERNDPEECGSMLYTGLLINIDCETRSFFICEHQLDGKVSPLSVSLSDSEQILQPYVGGGGVE
ncbi:hypothetical protein PYW08_003915 [Mythimna loreyi]|uniref:Uncharacterized protein n=1 Tax=Mythimna loreyi TaxID=667449 RepID=A0ACC2QUA2_9NEOP|nr:hypothetical protein PYW08_003915 [Mythimna loreyi]